MRASLINQYQEDRSALLSTVVNPSRFQEGDGMPIEESNGELGLVGEGIPAGKNVRHRVREYQLSSHLTSWSAGPMIEFRRRKM